MIRSFPLVAAATVLFSLGLLTLGAKRSFAEIEHCLPPFKKALRTYSTYRKELRAFEDNLLDLEHSIYEAVGDQILRLKFDGAEKGEKEKKLFFRISRILENYKSAIKKPRIIDFKSDFSDEGVEGEAPYFHIESCIKKYDACYTLDVLSTIPFEDQIEEQQETYSLNDYLEESISGECFEKWLQYNETPLTDSPEITTEIKRTPD